MNSDNVTQDFGSYDRGFKIDPQLIAEIEDPRLTPKQERQRAMHRLAEKVGLPSKKFTSAMRRVRKDLSYQSGGGKTRFSSKIILDWDEFGVSTGLSGFRGTDARVELSSRYQGIILRKNSNYIDRRLVFELDEVTYSASVPLDEVSFGRFFSSLNVFSFFVKE